MRSKLCCCGTRTIRGTALRLALALALLASHAGPAFAGSAWERYRDRFLEATFRAQPQLAVWAGRHEFDGRLPDWSAAGLRREIDRLREARRGAAAFRDEKLSEPERFERDYLIAVIDGDLFWLTSANAPALNPTYYAWGLDPAVYVTRAYAPPAQRMRAYVAYADAVPGAVRRMRANLRTPLPRSYVHIGRIIAGGLASFYRDTVPAVFASVDDRALKARFRKANASAIAAMRDLDAWFAQQEASATDAFALGPTQFAAMLKATEGVDLPLTRLTEIADRDLARNLEALRDACARLLPNAAVESCVAEVRDAKPADGPVREAARQLAELRSFVERSRLVTIPPSEPPRVAESPPYQRWNAAYIDVAGPLERDLPAIYYIAPPDPHWSETERHAYVPGESELLFISAHEVWPGHFLQFLHARRSANVLGRVFWSYTFNEGWAHYAEELMWEAGLRNGDPQAHVGQLLDALLRDVRLIVALGLHTNGLSVAQAEALFREKAFLDAGNARQQAARGTFDPGYGAYTLGKLMIRKLRDDWTASRGGREAWRAFHDELLSYGSPRLPLLRRAMLGADSGPPL